MHLARSAFITHSITVMDLGDSRVLEFTYFDMTP